MAATQTRHRPGGVWIGETRQHAKTRLPQTIRADGVNRRMRALPEPHNSWNEITVLSLLACGYHIALVVIGHGDDAEPVFCEKIGGIAGGNQ